MIIYYCLVACSLILYALLPYMCVCACVYLIYDPVSVGVPYSNMTGSVLLYSPDLFTCTSEGL